MRTFATLIVLFLSMLTASASGFEGSNSYIGRWTQVASNAGACATCAILVERRNGAFEITANNGWTATVWPVGARSAHTVPSLQGTGSWPHSAGAWFAGRPFRIAFVLDEGRLRMVMVMPRSAGRAPQRILADFVLSISY